MIFDSRTSIFLAALLSALLILDLLNVVAPMMGRLGMILWLASCLVLLAAAARCVLSLARSLVENRWWFSTALTGLLTVGLLANAADPRFLQYELPQEVACFLSRFPTNHAGFHEPCFLGYTTRSYAAASLPSLFFGRSVFLLKLGGSLYFFCGVWIFLWGLLHRLGPGRKSDLLALLAITFTFHCFAIPGILVAAEQSQAPFALSLALCGFYLRFLSTRRPVFAWLAGLVLFHLAAGYPPGLVVMGLAIAVLAWHVKLSGVWQERVLLGSIAVSTALVFAVSLGYRTDVGPSRLAKQDTQTTERATGAVQHLVIDQSSRPAFSSIMKPFAIGLILVSLTGLLGWKFAFLAVWFVVSAVAVTAATGYAGNISTHLFFRLAATAPILALMALEALGRIPYPSARTPAFVGALAVFFLAAAVPRWQHAVKIRSGDRIMPLVQWAAGPLKEKHPNVKTLIGSVMDPVGKDLFQASRDRLRYLRPDMKFVKLPGACTEEAPADELLLFADETNRCLREFANRNPVRLADFPGGVRPSAYLIPAR